MKKVIAFNIILLGVLIGLYYYLESNKSTVVVEPTPTLSVTQPINRNKFKSSDNRISFTFPSELGNAITQDSKSTCSATLMSQNIYFKNKPNLLIALYPCNYIVGDLNQLYSQTYQSQNQRDVLLTTYTQKLNTNQYVMLVQAQDQFFMQLETSGDKLSADKALLEKIIESLRVE